MCGGGSNSGNNDKQSLKEQAKNKKTAFSAETFGKMSPKTAAKFQGQGFVMGDDAKANAAANAAYEPIVLDADQVIFQGKLLAVWRKI